MSDYPILDGIHSPRDLDGLEYDELADLASEIRSFLVEKVTANGGHLASNLGVVELTLALHRVFECPYDSIVWDVGHQSFVHKILTGRRDAFDTLRKPGGLSGFTKRSESEYDVFGAGHSSTSVSAALGIAEAERLKGTGAYTVAVVGDGAFTGGMIHEALNNCEEKKGLNLIIVLNENEMSISKNTGRFAHTMAKLRTTPRYFRTKAATKRILAKLPLIGRPLSDGIIRLKKRVKNALYGSNYFEDLGFLYLGPVDGNDEEKLEIVLSEAKRCGQNAVVHVKTVKGKGFAPAENTPDLYHSVKPGNAPEAYGFSDCAGESLCKLAENDGRICAITAAMSHGTRLDIFKEIFPERFFDVGIAEEHALTFSAGLAAGGMLPCVAVYSTFLQRAYDNIIHDISLQKLPVVICIDRAGLNNGDGATHHGIFDVSFLSGIPEMNIYTPATYDALSASLEAAAAGGVPAAVRYPSGPEDKAIVREFYPNGFRTLSGVKFSRIDENTDTVIVCHGRMAASAIKAADMLREQGKNVGLALCEMIKPYALPCMILLNSFSENVKNVVFVEEEIRAGGFGMNMCDELRRTNPDHGLNTVIIATDDNFAVPGKGQTAAEAAGVDSASIAAEILKLYENME